MQLYDNYLPPNLDTFSALHVIFDQLDFRANTKLCFLIYGGAICLFECFDNLDYIIIGDESEMRGDMA